MKIKKYIYTFLLVAIPLFFFIASVWVVIERSQAGWIALIELFR